ncbi:hypothetical protein [Burkholderia ubonensis]|uniref:hypothetical protein n=1 Tax=Burkholderia ubonensis TaxID=101571 RepID=UPI0012F990B0|nr:hypothetical protein [Burkholderia ubonensis]
MLLDAGFARTRLTAGALSPWPLPRMLRGVSTVIFNNCHGRKSFEAAMRMAKQSNGLDQRQCMGFTTIPAGP